MKFLYAMLSIVFCAHGMDGMDNECTITYLHKVAQETQKKYLAKKYNVQSKKYMNQWEKNEVATLFSVWFEDINRYADKLMEEKKKDNEVLVSYCNLYYSNYILAPSESNYLAWQAEIAKYYAAIKYDVVIEMAASN